METQQNEQKYSDCAGKLSYQPTTLMRCLLLATEKYVRKQNEFSISCLLPEFSQYNGWRKHNNIHGMYCLLNYCNHQVTYCYLFSWIKVYQMRCIKPVPTNIPSYCFVVFKIKFPNMWKCKSYTFLHFTQACV